MSCTEVYGIHQDGSVKLYEEVDNSWGMHPFIWREIEERYLPIFRPHSIPARIPDDKIESYMGFRPSRFSLEGLKEIWDLFNTQRLTKTERWMLGSTFDRVIVMKEGFDELIQAFRTFSDKENHSLNELANVYEKMQADDDIIGVAWSTSLGDYPWFDVEWVDASHPDYEELDAGEDGFSPIHVPYNILTSKNPKHWVLNERQEDYVQEIFV